MSTKKAEQTEAAEKKTRKPRRQDPYMLAMFAPADPKHERLGGKDWDDSYLILENITPEPSDGGYPIEPIPNPNYFLSSADAMTAAALIPKFCTEHKIHIIQVSPRIAVTTRVKTTLKLSGE